MFAGIIARHTVGEKATCIGFIGTIWLNLMKMFLVPIVICMMVKGITSMDNPKDSGKNRYPESWSFICLPQWRHRSWGW
ncbi:MAG: cation:dicarboxylate symporter family transporter [Enterocloster bolteae]